MLSWCDGLCSFSLPCDGVGWYVVCNDDVSCSYSLAYWETIARPEKCLAGGLTVSRYYMTTTSFLEPWHELSNNVAYATSKGSDQPVHMRGLVRVFVSGLNIL